MHRPLLHRYLSRLALIAMLLLLAMPVVNRSLSSVGDVSGAWAQMCTLAGLKWVRLPPPASSTMLTSASDPAVAPFALQPADAPHGDADPLSHCPYCPLLNGIAALLLCAMLLWPLRATRWQPLWRQPPPRPRQHPTGLGSRGPPLTL